MFKRILASIVATALVMSTAVISVSAADTTAEFFDGFSIMGGFLTSTITSVKLVDPVAVEPVETEATTAESEETTSTQSEKTTAETADETNDTPETGVGLAFTLVAIPVVTLVTAAISKKRK
ncbi:MAG TPA: hypothetical protein VJX95_01265 [Oscillospiraceae bacterium]|nr:hypothetical protein [Oscillospiraceae bacterium]